MPTTTPLPFSAPAVPNMLGLACSVLEACGQAKPRNKRGLSAPWWDYTVPNSRAAVDILRRFVQSAGRLAIQVNGVDAGWVHLGNGPIQVASNGLVVGMEYSLLNGPVQTFKQSVPYPSLAAAQLCQRRWADFGAVQVGLPGSLLPSMSLQGDAVVLEWDEPPQLQFGGTAFFGLIRRMTHTTIKAIHIGPDSGEIITTGLVGWTIPRLIWS